MTLSYRWQFLRLQCHTLPSICRNMSHLHNNNICRLSSSQERAAPHVSICVSCFLLHFLPGLFLPSRVITWPQPNVLHLCLIVSLAQALQSQTAFPLHSVPVCLLVLCKCCSLSPLCTLNLFPRQTETNSVLSPLCVCAQVSRKMTDTCTGTMNITWRRTRWLLWSHSILHDYMLEKTQSWGRTCHRY